MRGTTFVSRRKKIRQVKTQLMLLPAAVASILAFASASAAAATAPGYPNATVQYMASARMLPYLRSDTYAGYVLHNPGTNYGNQIAAVSCWWDGDWAFGTYWTNRWFRVLVYESYDGYNVPRWLFVHASYVYNQPVVRHCYSTSTGIW